jgi:hypothetical protein
MCLEWIKGLDMFGKKVELQIEGRSSFKSYFGAAVTLIFLGFVTTVSAPTFLEYLSTDQPGIIGESYKRSQYPEINLHDAKHLPFLIAYSSEVDLIPFEDMKRYFTFTVEKIIWKENEVGGVLGYHKEIIYTEPVPCGSLSKRELANYDYLEKGSFLEDLLMNYAVCMPASSNLTVVGKGTDPQFVVISFKIKPCSLQNGVGCASEHELGKANFMWVTPMNTLDSTNYAQPRSKHANADDVFYVNPAIRQMYVAKFKENIVFDLKGIFDPKPIERVRYFDIADIFATSAFRQTSKITCDFAHTRQDDDSCYSYFEYTFQSSGAIFNFKRSYKTLRDTLGEIGGLIEVILLATLILISPVVDWQYRRFIKTKVFRFAQDKRLLHLLESRAHSESKKTTGAGFKGTSCCRKLRANPHEGNFESAIEKSLDKKLDAINFIEELNVISLLSKVFLQQQHIKLAPLASLADHLAEASHLREAVEKTGSPKTCDSQHNFHHSSYEATARKNLDPFPSPSNFKVAPLLSNILSPPGPQEFEQIMAYYLNQAKYQTDKPSKTLRKIRKVPDEYFFKLFASRLPPANPSPNAPVRVSPRRIKRFALVQLEQRSVCAGDASSGSKTDHLL